MVSPAAAETEGLKQKSTDLLGQHLILLLVVQSEHSHLGLQDVLWLCKEAHRRHNEGIGKTQ